LFRNLSHERKRCGIARISGMDGSKCAKILDYDL